MTQVVGHARSQEEALTLCFGCPKLCRHACPVSDADQNEMTTPWGKMSAMKLVADQKLADHPETMALAYKCLECRLCQASCELDNPVASVLDAFRRRAFQKGTAPGSILEYSRKFRDHNNPYGYDLRDILREKFAKRLAIKSRTVYLPGCTEIAESPETIGTVFRLFDHFGLKDVALYPERNQCCGYPLYAAGDWEGFRELAKENAAALRDYRQIVTGSPECLYTLETLYPEAGFPVRARLLHVLEFMNGALRVSGRSGSSFGKIAYHDPCLMGRFRKLYDLPREALRQATGSLPLEFSQNREYSYCCGAGGLLPVSSPETAAGVTRTRVQEFHRTGADVVVSSCPSCVRRFQDAGLNSKNVVDILADAFLEK